MDNSGFIVEDIAEQFNMSRASFYRKIKGVLNLTPNEYIRVERLKKAAQLLKEEMYRVNEICHIGKIYLSFLFFAMLSTTIWCLAKRFLAISSAFKIVFTFLINSGLFFLFKVTIFVAKY